MITGLTAAANGKRPFIPPLTECERLLALELEDAQLSERMHRDQVRRTQIREERLRLRFTMAPAEAARYAAMRNGA